MKKEDILAEIRRTAKENGGKPLGVARFEYATSIKPYDWQKYWARFGEAQAEAGFAPNTLQAAHSDELLLKKITELIRELGRFPTKVEMRLKRHNDPSFPQKDTFQRFGSKDQFITKVLEYSRANDEYSDVAEILEPIAKANLEADSIDGDEVRYGFVYLVKGHPGEYKIGRTNLVDRRLSELGATASIEQELIHEIKTDDPAGVEAYWHKRFAEKRMRGEWFKLSSNDVKTFKRWRRIY
ncbi:MAG: GIY-YIG nuclease family protein [Patescibacteria group bacterium]